MKNPHVLCARNCPQRIRAHWIARRAADVNCTNEQIADELAIPEASLLSACAATKEGAVVAEARDISTLDRIIRLRPQWSDLLAGMPSLGTVLSATGNRTSTLSYENEYGACRLLGPYAILLGNGVDLRIHLREWTSGYAISSPGNDPASPRRKLEFFGRDGVAIHRVLLGPHSALDSFWRMVWEYGCSESPDLWPVRHPVARPELVPATDCGSLLQSWARMQDAGEFPELLRRFGCGRAEAIALAEGRFTHRVGAQALRDILRALCNCPIHIALHAGNAGCMQVYRGPLSGVLEREGVVHISGERSTLQILESRIAAAWVVQKPHRGNWIYSLELFDHDGAEALSLFGSNSQRGTADPAWVGLLRQFYPNAIAA